MNHFRHPQAREKTAPRGPAFRRARLAEPSARALRLVLPWRCPELPSRRSGVPRRESGLPSLVPDLPRPESDLPGRRSALAALGADLPRGTSDLPTPTLELASPTLVFLSLFIHFTTQTLKTKGVTWQMVVWSGGWPLISPPKPTHLIVGRRRTGRSPFTANRAGFSASGSWLYFPIASSSAQRA